MVSHVRSAIENADGEIVRWYGVLTDVHERRLAEASLRVAQLRLSETAQKVTLSEFSSAVVHELSQPLTAMIVNSQACLEWLSKETPDVIGAKLAAESVIRDCNDARAIIAGLRNLFRNCPSQMHSFSLSQTHREVLSMRRGRGEKESVRISISIPSDLPDVFGEKLQVQQVLLNLINNAIDALQDIPEPRSVIVRSILSGAYILTEVQDRGIGIQEPERIFDSFYTTKPEGTGMGLSICKSIVDAHKGKLRGTAAVPKGAIFAFTLPVHSGESR
jgi:signal transduction histidine kinase